MQASMANPGAAAQAFDYYAAADYRNNLSETSVDIDAFLDSVLMQDPVPLGTDLLPAVLAQGLGLATDASQGNQGSNGRKQGSGKAPPISSARQGTGTAPSPGAQAYMRAPGAPDQRQLPYAMPGGADPARVQQTDAGPLAAAGLATMGDARQQKLAHQQQQQGMAPSGSHGTYLQQQMAAAAAQQQASQAQQAAYAQAYQQQAAAAYAAAAGQYGAGWGAPGGYPYHSYYSPQHYGMPYQMPYPQSGPAATMGPPPASQRQAGQQLPSAPPPEAAGAALGEDDEARAVKRPRLIWTDPLHRRFLDSVNRCGGVERALPKAIMKEMGVTGLTRENVASHLQKYRMRLKKGGGDDEHDGDSEFKVDELAPSPVLNNASGLEVEVEGGADVDVQGADVDDDDAPAGENAKEEDADGRTRGSRAAKCTGNAMNNDAWEV